LYNIERLLLKNKIMFIASLLIFVGLAFFLRNVGLVPSLNWGAIWPLILVWFGVYMVMWIHKASEGWRKIGDFFKRINKE